MNDAAHQNSNTGNNQDRMFLAIIVPAMRKEHPILVVACVAITPAAAAGMQSTAKNTAGNVMAASTA